MKLTRKVGNGKGDGHTSVPLWGLKTNKFPIKLFDFGNEIRVVKTSKDYASILGKKLKSINNKPIEEIYAKVSKLTPFTENKQSLMDRTCQYLVISDLLVALRFIDQSSNATFTFIDDNNNEEHITINSHSKEELDKLEYTSISFSHPKIIIPKDTKFKNLWFTSLNNFKTVYIKFKQYPSEVEMNTFSESIYNFIEKHQSNSLIIDLRDNYGGDFFMGMILTSWLNTSDFINWKSNVYVLVDRVTYSAAMVNAVQFKQLLNAKIVGEPTGANPNGYQDLGQFNLPNSKLLITYTKRKFRLQDEITEGLIPDIIIEPNWLDYKNGFDRVLNWTIDNIKF